MPLPLLMLTSRDISLEDGLDDLTGLAVQERGFASGAAVGQLLGVEAEQV